MWWSRNPQPPHQTHTSLCWSSGQHLVAAATGLNDDASAHLWTNWRWWGHPSKTKRKSRLLKDPVHASLECVAGYAKKPKHHAEELEETKGFFQMSSLFKRIWWYSLRKSTLLEITHPVVKFNLFGKELWPSWAEDSHRMVTSCHTTSSRAHFLLKCCKDVFPCRLKGKSHEMYYLWSNIFLWATVSHPKVFS